MITLPRNPLALVLGAIAVVLAAGSPVKAATFQEMDFDTGQLLSEAQGAIAISGGDQIEGFLFNPRDVDLYKLQLDAPTLQASVSSESDLNLFLFDATGRGIKSAVNELSLSGAVGETFYLGVNGIAALNEEEEVLLDPTMPDFVGSGTLGGWIVPDVVIQVVIPYEITFEVQDETDLVPSTSVAEPSPLLGISLVGGMVFLGFLKPYLRPI